MGTKVLVTNTRTHVFVGFANPFLRCEECEASVLYWHNSERCGCDTFYFNHPCGHQAGIYSICYSWSPVTGCNCENRETHDKE